MSTADDRLTAYALAAGKGDADATAALIQATRADVWRFIAGLTSAAEADDLTQDTYLRAVRALPGYAARSSARTWLLAIARRVCADHLRVVVRQRRLRERLSQLPPEHTGTEHSGPDGSAELLAALTDERRVEVTAGKTTVVNFNRPVPR